MTTPLPILTPTTESDQLIDDFTHSPQPLADLARAYRMTIPAMLSWARVPLNQRTLRAIRDLTDARTDLIVSSARSEAAHALRHLAVASESAETQRKACVDLLRLGVPASPARAKGAKDASTDSGANAATDPDALRRMLEDYGAQMDADPARDQAGGEGSPLPAEHAA